MSDVVVVDLNSLGVPIWMTSTNDADPDSTSTRIVQRVRAMTSGAAYSAIALDCPPYFRRDIYPEYKAHRPPSEEPMRFQINKAADILRADGYPVFGVRGFEADDLAATIVARVLETRPDDSVLVISSDKDLCALVGPRVRLKSVRDGSLIDEAVIKEKFGVTPAQMVDLLTLWGDSSDGIKGADKIGVKIAGALLNEFGSLDGIYEAIDKGPTFTMTPNLRTRLQDFRPNVDVIRRVIQLRFDVPIDIAPVFAPRVATNDVAMFDDEAPTGPSTSGSDSPRVAPSGGDSARSFTYEDALAEMHEAMPGLMTPKPEKPAHADAVAGAMPDGPAHAKTTTKEAALSQPMPAPATSAAKSEVLPVVHEVAQGRTLTPDLVDYERQLEPRSLSEAYKLATSMFQARLFSAYGNADAVLSTILAGREFGMPAMASLRAFHVVEGRPMLAADTIRALILRSGAAEYFRCSERTNTRATFVTKRHGEPETALSYTIEEGRQAFNGDDVKFAKSGWGKNPADMCVARAGAKLARLVYPDVVHGVYAKEEME